MHHRWVRWVLAGASVLFTLCTAAWAKTGFAVVSDWHAYYGNLEDLAKQIAFERHRFLEENPDGEFVVVFNGDNAGLSAYTYFMGDRGQLIYEFMKVLARSPRTRLQVGIGNHDGFDVDGPAGNELFYRQTEDLVKSVETAQGRPFRLVNANLHLTEATRPFIAPYQDMETRAGKVRVVGFVLDEFFKKCGYSRTSGRRLFDGLTPARAMVDRVIEDAVRDGVKILVPVVHDYAKEVGRLKGAFEMRIAKLGHSAKLRMPWAIAAHDHIQQVDRNQGILDAGSNGGMVFAEIDDHGRRGPTALYRPTPPEKRTVTASEWNTEMYLSAEERAFLALNVPRIEAIRKQLSTIVGYAPASLVRKERVKRGVAASGTLMAETLRLWVENEVTKDVRSTNRPAVAFYNSSSFRYDYDIQEGDPITNEMLFGFYPLEGLSPRRGFVAGSILVKLYESARVERMQRDRTHTPQLSANLREVRCGNGPSLCLEWYDASALRWKLVEPNDRFPFAIDGFLGADGYEIPGWKELLRQVDWIGAHTPVSQRGLVFNYTPWLLRPTPLGHPRVNLTDYCGARLVGSAPWGLGGNAK